MNRTLKNMLTRLLSLLLALILALSMTACGSSEASTSAAAATTAATTAAATEAQTTEEPTTEASTTEAATTEAAEGYVEGELVLNEYLPTYYHYDGTAFLESCEKMKTLLNDGDMETFYTLYEELSGEILKVIDLYQVVEVLTDLDVTNTQMQNETVYAKSLYEELKNEFNTVCSLACKSEKAEEFRAYLADDTVYNAYKNYGSQNDALLKLKKEEEELIQQFKTLNNDWDQFTFNHVGTDYCWSDINEFTFETVKEFNVYYGVMEAINEGLGEVYVKLVKNRQKQAEIMGYDSYADYADKELYGRTYTQKDLDILRETVQYYGEELYYDCLSFANVTFDIDVTGEELLQNIRKVMTQVSDLAVNSVDKMLEEGVYDIDTRDNKTDGGYIEAMASIPDGFLLYTMTGTTYDYEVISHEMGHYTEATLNDNPYDNIIPYLLDIFETHSTGLQILFAMKAEECYGENADLVYGAEVVNLLSYVYEGFLGDSFERLVYADKDITLEKVNEYYKQVCEDYGMTYYQSQEYEWVGVLHYFEAPLYMLSYGMSGFTSLQIYNLATDNYEAGVKAWESIVQADTVHKGYKEIVVEAGLGLYTDEKLCDNTIWYPLNEVRDILAEYEE